MKPRAPELQPREAVQQLFQHVQQLQIAVLRLDGAVKAQQYVLDVLAGSHPAPDALHATWVQVLPTLIDELTVADAETTDEQHEGWRRTLAHYSGLFEALKDRIGLDSGHD